MSRRSLYALVLLLSAAGWGWVAFNAAAAGSDGMDPGARHGSPGFPASRTMDAPSDRLVLPSPCPFRLATGLPCPSCGTTRSLLALADGDPADAARSNPFGFPAALALLVLPAWILHDLLRGGDGFHRAYGRTEAVLRQRPAVALAVAAVVIVNWGWNILKGV